VPRVNSPMWSKMFLVAWANLLCGCIRSVLSGRGLAPLLRLDRRGPGYPVGPKPREAPLYPY
jgi:hypothetical protein